MSEQAIATFCASIPPIAGAIKMHGEGEYRIALEVPETDMEQVQELEKHGRNKVLYVVIMEEGV